MAATLTASNVRPVVVAADATRDVSAIVDELGPHLVIGARGALDRLVRSVDVTDAAHPTAASPGSLLIAVGHTTSSCAELMQSAHDQGAAAILLKGTTLPIVFDGGPAVVLVDPTADWGQVIALARMAMTEAAPAAAHHAGPTFALADIIAGLCGGPVIMYDAAWQLVAYSGGGETDPVRTEALLARRLPQRHLDVLHEAGVIDRVLRGDVVRLTCDDVPGIGERYAAAVLVGGQLLGTIWVVPTGGLSDADTRDGVRRAVVVAASTLLRQSASTSSGQAHSIELGSLLAGAHTDRLVAERLGVPADHGFAIAGLRALGGDTAERAITARRLVSLARDYCDAYRSSALIAAVDDTAYVLFPCASSADRQRALRVVTDLQEQLSRSIPNRAMLGRAFTDLHEITTVRSSVEEMLALAERRGWAGLIDADSMEASLRLAQFREIALAHSTVLDGPAARLIDHDRHHAAELLPTLRAYFEAVGDVNEVGRRLELHPNTVRYRMRRVEEVAGLRLNDPDDRLLAELQVRLLIP